MSTDIQIYGRDLLCMCGGGAKDVDPDLRLAECWGLPIRAVSISWRCVNGHSNFWSYNFLTGEVKRKTLQEPIDARH